MSLKKLGRYDLVRVLGKGAMGVVYEGRDPNLERRVAIKTVKVENLSEEAAAEYESRFRTEARSAARLQHPNIVSVYDSDRDGDVAFLVMEYIQGDDLKHHLDRGVRYSLEQSLKMIRDLLAALDYAHKAGIVHRDIKPANLLIEPGGRVKLTDFGVARMQDSGEATRTQGSMVGTLKYMSPEQVQGLKIDSRADLFSVGVVLYQLLTDKRPFDGENDFSIIHQIIGHTPPAPSSFNSRLPTAIDAVVARSLAKDRDQRFATARDFAVSLQSAIRRAEDATVVPPADPFKKPDTAITNKGTAPSLGGGGSPTNTGTSGTSVTVTQELELVYWKDIKDSTDRGEIEGFLHQFPAGIYADLARRRLRKLSGGDASDQTVMTGPLSGARAPDLDETRMRTDESLTTSPQYVASAAAVASGVAAAAAARTAPPNVGPKANVPQATPAVAPAVKSGAGAVALDGAVGIPAETPAVAPAGEAAADESRLPEGDSVTVPPKNWLPTVRSEPGTSDKPAVAPERQPPSKTRTGTATSAVNGKRASGDKPAGDKAVGAKKPPIAVLAGVGALVVAGLIAFNMMGKSGNTDVAAARPVPAASQPTPAVRVGPAPRPAVETAAPAAVAPAPATTIAAAGAAPPPPASALLPTVAAGKAASAASSPRRSASAAARRATTPASVAVVAPPPFSNPVPPEAREPREPQVALRPSVPVVAASPRPTPPSETCKDKVFLSRQVCLQEECSRPIFQNSPTCARFREEAGLREDSKIRN